MTPVLIFWGVIVLAIIGISLFREKKEFWFVLSLVGIIALIYGLMSQSGVLIGAGVIFTGGGIYKYKQLGK